MKRTRFTPTRAVLVIILIGGLYKVGTLVNPPPVGPPATPQELATKLANDASAASKPPAMPAITTHQQEQQMKSRMQAQYKQTKYMAEKEKLEKELNHGQPLKKDDGITPVYFQDTPMGTAGFAKTAQDSARIKRITDEVNKRMPPAPSSTANEAPMPPLPIPPAGAKASAPAASLTPASGK